MRKFLTIERWMPQNSIHDGRCVEFLPIIRYVGMIIVGCLAKFMLTTATLFDTGIILGKMHCSRNFIIIGVVLKQIIIN